MGTVLRTTLKADLGKRMAHSRLKSQSNRTGLNQKTRRGPIMSEHNFFKIGHQTTNDMMQQIIDKCQMMHINNLEAEHEAGILLPTAVH